MPDTEDRKDEAAHEITNDDRRRWAMGALTAYMAVKEVVEDEDYEGELICLLGDLLHLRDEIDPDDARTPFELLATVARFHAEERETDG